MGSRGNSSRGKAWQGRPDQLTRKAVLEESVCIWGRMLDAASGTQASVEKTPLLDRITALLVEECKAKEKLQD